MKLALRHGERPGWHALVLEPLVMPLIAGLLLCTAFSSGDSEQGAASTEACERLATADWARLNDAIDAIPEFGDDAALREQLGVVVQPMLAAPEGAPLTEDVRSARPASAPDGTMPRMAIKAETRKRLWGKSGNRCAKCGAELVRSDESGLPGALVGEEAHMIARSPGGARYEPRDPTARDGYDNLILLCANDQSEVDAQPSRYTVASLRTMKRRHELWVKSRLHAAADDGPTLARVMRSGNDLWPLISRAFGRQLGMPEGSHRR